LSLTNMSQKTSCPKHRVPNIRDKSPTPKPDPKYKQEKSHSKSCFKAES